MDQNLSLMGAPPASSLPCCRAVRTAEAGPGLSPLLGAPVHAGPRPAVSHHDAVFPRRLPSLPGITPMQEPLLQGASALACALAPGRRSHR